MISLSRTAHFYFHAVDVNKYRYIQNPTGLLICCCKWSCLNCGKDAFQKRYLFCLPVDEWHKHHMTTFQSYKSISETTAVLPILKDVCGNMIFISCRPMSETNIWLRSCRCMPYLMALWCVPHLMTFSFIQPSWPIFYIDVCQKYYLSFLLTLSVTYGISFLQT